MEYVQPIPKPEYKKHSSKSIHDFTSKVKKQEYEEAKGLCRICQSEPITQYHHITEKGMGGGRGLGIQINCLGVGDRCHNHDNTEFLQACDRILNERINELFSGSICYLTDEIENILKIDYPVLQKQIMKGFLKLTEKYYGDKAASRGDIKRWLKGVA